MLHSAFHSSEKNITQIFLQAMLSFTVTVWLFNFIGVCFSIIKLAKDMNIVYWLCLSRKYAMCLRLYRSDIAVMQ